MFTLNKIKEIINDPSSLDVRSEFIFLNHKPLPDVLVYGHKLSKTILAINSLIPTNTIDYFKALNINLDLSSVEDHFRHSPFFLHGKEHFDSRRQLIPFYKKIEINLQKIIDVVTSQYFQNLSKKDLADTIKIASDYIELVFKNIIARDLGCEISELPDMPGEIFHFFPARDALANYDQRINKLKEFIENKLFHHQRDKNESWMLMSIAIMGTETLLSALVYGMLQEREGLSRMLAAPYEVNPVTIIGRIAKEKITLNELELSPGQEIFISPSLVYDRQPNKLNPDVDKLSIAFGHGVHICPGRKISLIILESYFKEWLALNFNVEPKKVEFKKDLINRPIGV